MMASSLAEVVSLGAVVPFLGLLTAPDLAFAHPLIISLAASWGVTTSDQLILPATIVFAVAALAAGALRLLLLWVSTRLAFSAGSDLSIELYRRTLYQPYKVHAARNTSAVLSGVGKVGGAMNVLSQCLLLISSAILLISIVAALIVVEPFISSVAIVGFGVCYGIITWVARGQLQQNSQRIADEQTRVFRAVQEGLGGIRDVHLDGTQPLYCDVYSKADRPLRRGQGNNIFIAGSPRFAMEALGMVLIAGLAYFLSGQEGGIVASIPVLGALALGAQRLLPALQQGYSAWATIIGSQASLADTIELLDQPLPATMPHGNIKPLDFSKEICFEAVSFKFASDAPNVLEDLNLTISRGMRIGLVGATGSGKSTALDILMGLLEPTQGRLLVDGRPLEGERLYSWQRAIAHVPQNIYLADSSIAENIAFGISPDQIDMDRAKEAARQAQIADFIASRHGGYQAQVGERGIRLSGGQRQRLAIARALYKRARVLVFDEATSALDNITEQALMVAINSLSDDLTIIMVAHRLSTVRECDLIVELDDGRVRNRGSFDELVSRSQNFQLATHEKH